MKYIPIFIFILTTTLSYSQSVVQKYNSLLNRYEYFDESGSLIGYKTYNSLLNQYEYYDNKTSKRTTDYGSYVTPVNLKLVAKILAQKQARYDNLSYEEKLRLSQQSAYREYQNQKAYTTNEFFKVYDKSEKKYLKQVKMGMKIFNDNKYKKNKNILEFSDGWYKCFYVSEADIDGSKKSVNYARFIQVMNGNVINYVGNYNILYPVVKFTSSSSFLTLTIGTSFVENEDVMIYCISDKPLNNPPKFTNGVTKLFYTTLQDGGKTDILINHDGEYIYLGKIKEFWQDTSYLSCDTEQGVIRVNLPIGKYEYYAFADIRIWKGEFTLDENNYCHKTNLISK